MKEKSKLLWLFSFFILILFIKYFTIDFFNIRSSSMSPTLVQGDIIIVSKLYNEIQHNDIIVFRHSNGEKWVKRVIAKENDIIYYNASDVYLNGKNITYGDTLINMESYRRIIISKDDYFLMGDNYQVSSDSRDFGVIHKDKILGKAKLILISKEKEWKWDRLFMFIQ